MQPAAEHLVAAADRHQLAAVTQVAAAPAPSLGAQPGESAWTALEPGSTIRSAGGMACPGPTEIHLRVQAQRVEVGVVGDARIDRRDQRSRASSCRAGVGQRVLGIEEQARADKGSTPSTGRPVRDFQPVEAGLQQADIATESG